MQSLPPIRPAAADRPAAAGVTTDVHTPAPALTTASATDGINRNQLRLEAGRRVQHITRGVAEQQTYLQMLQHIREQFAHTSQEALQPLVLPPQYPSTARPREPQTTKFSRGIALLKANAARTNSATATAGGDDGAGEGGDATTVARRPSSLSPPPAAAAGRRTTAADGATSDDSYVPTELPSTSSHFARAHRWEATDTADRTFFQHGLLRTAAYGGSGRSSAVASAVDMSPLDELPTFEEKTAYLAQLESASRLHVLAYEKWDQQVVSEMMAVRYVTFVLKPCMDALRGEEAEEREKIRQAEDRASFFMFHESPLLLSIRDGMRAMMARELQLDRILGVTPAPPRPVPQLPAIIAGTEAATAALPADGSEGQASDPPPAFASFRASRSSACVSGGNYSGSARSSRASPAGLNGVSRRASALAPSNGVPSPEARRILHEYVRQRHGAAIDAALGGATSASATPTETWVPASTATYPGTYVAATGTRDPIRRSSALVLPPLPSAHAPRRNAVGIADYVALLDDCMAQRDHLVAAERQARADVNRLFYEEQQVVLEWQRRRMHLERLLYWRQQREEAVQGEVAALTEVNVGAPLPPKLVLLLEMVEGDEEDGRAALQVEEERARAAGLDARAAALQRQHGCTQLTEFFFDGVAQSVWEAEGLARQELALHEETSVRQCREAAALSEMATVLTDGMAQLRVLWRVSNSPAHCSALRTLQHAFRRSLRGHLGWRASNAALGRAINDARNSRKIAAGQRTLTSFRAKLEAEAAQLRREVEAQHVREQGVLLSGEAAGRVAVSAEQDLARQAIRRVCVLNVAAVYGPLFARLTAAEASARMALDVEAEVDAEALQRADTAVRRLITRRARTRFDEAARRKSLVAGERAAWRELLGQEVDRREELRLDVEAYEAMHHTDREDFVQAALAASRGYRERALTAHVRQVTEVQLELLGHDAIDSADRRAIAAAESAAAVALFSSLSADSCELRAAELLRLRQADLDLWQRQAVYAAETERRAEAVLMEAIEWDALKPLLAETLSGPLRDLIVRRGAVNAIGTWYTAVRRGEMGRAVTRQRLRDDLARCRDERQLRQQQIAQRLHAQHVREQLDTLLREAHAEEVAALQQRLDILVLREEPRDRRQVEAMQEIVIGIIVRNAEAQTAAVRRQLVNTEALLWQQESYERKLLVKASRREFKELMAREKRQLSEDYFAARIQRTWARFVERKAHAQSMTDQRDRLSALEQLGRLAVEMEECEAMALGIAKPSAAAMYGHQHVQQALSLLYRDHCLTVLASTSALEWQARAALLWEMRYELCDSCLCTEEEGERRALTREFHRPFVLQRELVERETAQRAALVAERTAFLLRLLAREEQARRRDVVAAEVKALAAVRAAVQHGAQIISPE